MSKNPDSYDFFDQVTPRPVSPVRLPELPIEVPPVRLGSPLPDEIPFPRGPEVPHVSTPTDDSIPWCPVPPRRSQRRRASPKRMPRTILPSSANRSKKRSVKRRRRTPSPARHSVPPSMPPSAGRAQSEGYNTPKTSHPNRRKRSAKRRSRSPAAAGHAAHSSHKRRRMSPKRHRSPKRTFTGQRRRVTMGRSNGSIKLKEQCFLVHLTPMPDN